MVIKLSKNRLDAGGEQFRNAQLQSYSQTAVVENSGTSYTLDLSRANFYRVTLNANCTFTFANGPTSTSAKATLMVLLAQDNVGGRTATWPAFVSFAQGTSITDIANTATLLRFSTVNGGANWYGEVVESSALGTPALPSAPTTPTAQNTLWAWGYNKVGEIGSSQAAGTTTGFSSPVQISTVNNWSQIASVGDHTSAVRTDGTLWAWGYNTKGQLGVSTTAGTTTGVSSPVQVGTLTTWRAVGAGRNHSFGIQSDGSLWVWGLNNKGQLGTSQAAGTATGASSPVQVGVLTTWASTSGGQYHSLALKTDGTLWAMGYNLHGELGVATNAGTSTGISSPVQVGTLTNWTAIAAGRKHSLGIRTDGTLWAWGYNKQGQLGVAATAGTTTGVSSPTQVGTLNNWAAIASTELHALALKTDGSLWAWGYNDFGELGDGTVVARSSPVQVGALTNWASIAAGRYHSIAIKTDSSLWGWGGNYVGELGITTNAGNTTGISSPVQIGSATNWTGLALGFSTTIALRAPTQNTVWAWGLNSSGQLGQGDASTRSSPVQVGTLTNWSVPASGYKTNLTIKTDGSLWGWGLNTFAQTGDSSITNRSSPVQIGALTTWSQVASGTYTGHAIRSDGTLWSWGRGIHGRLGLGDVNDRTSPTQVGGLTNWSQIAAGNYYTAAIRTDGTLWVWGRGPEGELGTGDVIERSSPVQIGTDTSWTAITAGYAETHALKNGALWGWGYNQNGGVGDSTSIKRSSPVQIGTDTNWAAVSQGALFTVALKTNGTLWTWGRGLHGALGQRDTIDRSSPTQVGALTNWAQISAGEYGAHVAAIKTDGTLWVWGWNNNGQLGLGDAVDRSSPVQVGTGTNWAKVKGAKYHTIAIQSS